MQPLRDVYITLEYGVARSYWISPTHTGRDYRANTGTPVYACQAGSVVHSGYGGLGSSYGNHVVVSHQTPYTKKRVRVIYAHLSGTDVHTGQEISKGQRIGSTGATGNVTGPHLHLEQRHSPYGYWDNEFPSVVNDRNVRPTARFGAISWVRVRQEKYKAVKRIQTALNKTYPARKISVTGRWGKPTKTLYAFHQRHLGFKNGEADGQPGKESMKKLGFRVD